MIADDTTMVYSPVSKNIEAGSTSVEKPNAIVLAGVAGDRIASAAGPIRSRWNPTWSSSFIRADRGRGSRCEGCREAALCF
jgi:hypothetical protein